MGQYVQDSTLGIDRGADGSLGVVLSIGQSYPPKHHPSPALGWRDLLWLRQQARIVLRGSRRLGWFHGRTEVVAWVGGLSPADHEQALLSVLSCPRLTFGGLLWAGWVHTPPPDGVPDPLETPTGRSPRVPTVGSGLVHRWRSLGRRPAPVYSSMAPDRRV